MRYVDLISARKANVKYNVKLEIFAGSVCFRNALRGRSGSDSEHAFRRVPLIKISYCCRLLFGLSAALRILFLSLARARALPVIQHAR